MSLVIALSTAADAIIHDFDISVGDYSRVIGSLGLLSALLVLGVGPLIQRFSSRPLIVVGLSLKGAVFATTSFAPTFGALAAMLLPTCPLHAIGEQPTHHVLMKGYFRKLLPSAIATVNMGYSLCGALTPLLLAPAISAYGWRSCYLFLGILYIAGGAFAFCAVRPGPLEVKISPDPRTRNDEHDNSCHVTDETQALKGKAGAVNGTVHSTNGEFENGKAGKSSSSSSSSLSSPARSSVPDGYSVREALRTPRFYALMAISFLTNLWEGVIVMHFLLILQMESKLTLVKASYFYSAQYLCAIIGKQSYAALYPILPRAAHFYVLPLLFCLCHLLINAPQPGGGFAITTDEMRISIFTVVYGLSFGYTHSLHLAQPALLLGRKDLAIFQTLYYGANFLGGPFGGVIVGAVHDTYGSYSPALMISFAATALMYVIDLYLARVPELI
mmetsp:Transcript_32393/g.71014  ORF Transcript_32393/g.71014 Transcript_32393/m.71014 type:complete len:444 (-) Transcript_32393:194-1525(-)